MTFSSRDKDLSFYASILYIYHLHCIMPKFMPLHCVTTISIKFSHIWIFIVQGTDHVIACAVFLYTCPSKSEVNFVLMISFLIVKGGESLWCMCCCCCLSGWPWWSECSSRANDMEDSCSGHSLGRSKGWYWLQPKGAQRQWVRKSHLCFLPKDWWSYWHLERCSCPWHGN